MALTLRITSYQDTTLGEDRSKVFDGVGGSLGRSPTADWVLPDPKRYISNKHASIEYKDGAYFVTDLSTNGVFINDATDALGKNNTVKLDNGDKLSIGDYEIEVNCGDQLGNNDIFSNEYAALSGEFAENDHLNGHENNPGINFEGEGIDTSSNHFMPNNQFAENNVPGGSIPSIKDPLDLFGPSVDNDPGQFQPSGQQDQDPLGVFDNDPEQSSRLLDHNPGLHQSFTPPGVTSENLIPDDWNLTHFPIRNDNNSNTSNAENVQITPASLPPKNGEHSGEFPQTPESLFGELPEQWSQTGLASDSYTSQGDGTDQAPKPSQNVFSNTSIPNFASTGHSSQEKPTSSSFHMSTPTGNAHRDQKYVQSSRGNEYEVFLRSMGLDLNNIPAELADELPHLLGSVFKELVKGVMEVLNARANLKGAFRVSQTIIQPVENNPLKFAVNTDDAIRNMLFDQEKGYLSALDSVQEGFADMKAHQMAMMAGMQAAFTAMLHRFDPSELANQFDNTKGAGVFNKKAKYWDMYGELFVKISRAAEDNFQNLLGEEFAAAYESQISKLKPKGKPMGRKSNF